jgi:hypothetical protein
MSDAISRLANIFNKASAEANSDLEEIANRQNEAVESKEKLRELQSKLDSSVGGPSDAGPIQQGIAAAKDVFEIKQSNPLYEVRTDGAAAQVKFGDGVEGKRLPDGQEISTQYRTGQGKTGNVGGPVDPNALVQSVLKESYLQTTEDLRFYADKVKHFNDLKKELREELSNVANPELLEKLDDLSAGKAGNIFEQIYLAMKESIQDANQDKQYYLGKLQKMNDISKFVSGQLETISDASERLSKKEKDDDD